MTLGINTLKQLISQNTPRSGGIVTALTALTSTETIVTLKTGKTLKTQ